MELHGGRRVVCMKESIGYSAEDLAAYEGEEDIPDPIAITCAGHVGMLQTMCKSRAERIHDVASDKIVGGGEFERMSGCGSSKNGEIRAAFSIPTTRLALLSARTWSNAAMKRAMMSSDGA